MGSAQIACQGLPVRGMGAISQFHVYQKVGGGDARCDCERQ